MKRERESSSSSRSSASKTNRHPKKTPRQSFLHKAPVDPAYRTKNSLAPTLLQAAKKRGFAGSNQAGRESAQTVLCKPKSYDKDRIRQFLQHVSRQFYYAAKAKGVEPVEIEVLYHEADNSLYVSANQASALQILRLASEKEGLVTLLSRNYASSATSDPIQHRTALKMRQTLRLSAQRLDKFTSTEQAVIQNIVRCLTQAQLGLCQFNKQSADGGIAELNNRFRPAKDTIYFLDFPQRQSKQPHAEVWLAELAARFMTDQPLYIYGKKRPCFTCTAFLVDAKTHATTLEHSSQSGKLFYGQMSLFSPPAAKAVFDALPTRSTRVSVDADGVKQPGYATLSDSPAEPESADDQTAAQSSEESLSSEGLLSETAEYDSTDSVHASSSVSLSDIDSGCEADDEGSSFKL